MPEICLSRPGPTKLAAITFEEARCGAGLFVSRHPGAALPGRHQRAGPKPAMPTMIAQSKTAPQGPFASNALVAGARFGN
jgi:hypothetical protein